MCKDVPDVDTLTVVVDGCNQAKFVSTDVKYSVRGNVICRAKGGFDRIEIREVAPLHHAKPRQK
jgi:hypothetical protein